MNTISKKKILFKISDALRDYLKGYSLEHHIPVSYNDLIHYENSMPLYDKAGIDTLWETVFYQQSEMSELNEGLTKIYALLKTEGDMSFMEHLTVERIDYCPFGNSKPFRVRIKNNFNDNYDYFYVKTADASRVYGLELENTLSPNTAGFIVDGITLIEEHIAGIPGDQFIKDYIGDPQTNEIRLAKEFVKFNERCFVRLLGDMRSYNYIVDMTPDFDDIQYRIRSIDFDQQCYEGQKSMYLPQFFKENNPLVDLAIKHMTPETISQYQQEERSLMARRILANRYRLKDILDVLCQDTISTPEKVNELKKGLAKHYDNNKFLKCENMGEVLKQCLKLLRHDI